MTQIESNGKDYDKISPVAKLLAYLRSFSDIQYAREISQAIGGERVAREILGEDFSIVSHFAPIFELRHKSFEPYLVGKKMFWNWQLVCLLKEGLSLQLIQK